MHSGARVRLIGEATKLSAECVGDGVEASVVVEVKEELGVRRAAWSVDIEDNHLVRNDRELDTAASEVWGHGRCAHGLALPCHELAEFMRKSSCR